MNSAAIDNNVIDKKLGLTLDQWETLSHVLALVPYPVYAFGSRAAGDNRRYSDLDLYVDHPLTLAERARLNGAFDESDLPIYVDIIDHTTSDKTFRARIESTMQRIQ